MDNKQKLSQYNSILNLMQKDILGDISNLNISIIGFGITINTIIDVYKFSCNQHSYIREFLNKHKTGYPDYNTYCEVTYALIETLTILDTYSLKDITIKEDESFLKNPIYENLLISDIICLYCCHTYNIIVSINILKDCCELFYKKKIEFLQNGENYIEHNRKKFIIDIGENNNGF